MQDIQKWMAGYTKRMQETFENRIIFIGLQGSYARGEAKENSDIDVVLLLDHLTLEDLNKYRTAVADLPERTLLCGFIAGKEELAAWDPADLFQFCHDTVPYWGDLTFLQSRIREEDIRRAVHRGGCDIYHACCHNYLHENSAEVLRSCFKSAFFILQAKHHLETGIYLSRKADLLPCLSGRDRAVLATLLNDYDNIKFSEYTELLLTWTSDLIRNSEKATEIFRRY